MSPRTEPSGRPRGGALVSAFATVALAVAVTGAATGWNRGAAARSVGGAATRLVDLAPPSVRADFEAGIVALHDFWLDEAELRFRAVQRGAPEFALGYWGEAMALHRDPFGHREPPVERMREILARLAPTPEARATLANDALAAAFLGALEILVADRDTPAERHPEYARRMADVARAHPDAIEAQSFHARALLLEAPSFGHARDVQARVVAASRAVLARDPEHHGGLHYLIHGSDSPETARAALSEADRYQRLARGSSHALHMPSHIYMQLGLWDRVVEGNRAALRASEEWIRVSGGTMAALDRHPGDFLVYGLLQQGREEEAAVLLDRTRAERAEFESGALRWYDALWSARFAVEVGVRSEVPLTRSGYGSVGEALGLGLHALMRGDTATAETLLAEIEERAADDEGDVVWRIAKRQLEAALAPGDDAVASLREAIRLQAGMPRPNETPDLVKPPEELLGEILLELGRAGEALEAFGAADARWPSRLATRLGRARSLVALGRTDSAREAYACVLAQLAHADPRHPARIEARGYLVDSGGLRPCEVGGDASAGGRITPVSATRASASSQSSPAR